MAILYEIPLSPYAQKIKLALLEKGIAFECQLPDVDKPDAAFVENSPRLEVPVFVDDAVRLFDSSIILEYLEDRWPERPLLPGSAVERARVRTLEEICDTYYDAVNWGVSEITYFKRAEGALAERMLAAAKRQIAGLNAWLERELASRAWFNGEQFGYGDIVVYPFVNAALGQGHKPALDSRLSAWLKAMRARPSTARLKADILASLAHYAARPKDVAEGRHRREYRDHRLDWMLRSGGVDIVLAGMRANDIRFSREIE